MELIKLEPKQNGLRNPQYLFHESGFLNSGYQENDRIYLGQSIDSRLMLRVALKEGSAVSYPRASFGGIDYEGVIPSDGDLSDFLNKVIDALTKEGINVLVIYLAPDYYDPVFMKGHSQVLEKLGFQLFEEGQSFFRRIGDAFEQGLHDSHLRRLKRIKTIAWEVIMGGPELIEEFVGFGRKASQERGLPFSMDRETLQDQFGGNPDRYDLFLIKDDNRIVAGGIGMAVSKKVYYSFLPRTLQSYSSQSPMILLNQLMFEEASRRNCEVFDLGIAAPLGEKENSGLETFKLRQGAEVGRKTCYKIKF